MTDQTQQLDIAAQAAQGDSNPDWQQLSAPGGSALVGYRSATVEQKLGERLSGADYKVDYTGTTSSNSKMLNLVAEGQSSGKTVHLGPGTIDVQNITPVSTAGVRVEGEGMHTTLLKRSGASSTMTFKGKDFVELCRFTLDLNKPQAADTGHGITLIDQPRARLKEVSVVGNRGIGSSIIAYSSSSAVRQEGIVFDDIFVEGDIPNSSNTNGTLIENGLFCRQTGIVAKNIREFAVEYKNDTRYSLLSDIIAHNSNYGVGFGQTTTGDIGVTGCVSTGIIAQGCGSGIVVGKGDLNVFSAVMLDSSDSFSTIKRGVSTTLAADRNMFVGILTAGDMLEPARFGSNRNYIQVASHDTAKNVIVLMAGAEKNVAEIAHPGHRTTILGSIGNLSGNPLSGASSNPVYCHATGEYAGTLSGRWRYRHDVSGSSLLSAAKHVIEGKGDVTYGVSSDGTGYAGLQVFTPGKSAFVVYRPGATDEGNWQIGDGDASMLISRASLHPGRDGVTSLGRPSNRFSEVHAATATIVTSDARFKSEIEAISGAEIRACNKIEFRKFKKKDAVLIKGESARIHFGAIAQQVKEAFESEGLDPFDYGLFCYDEWEAAAPVFEVVEYGDVFAQGTTGSDEKGALLQRSVKAGADAPGTVWEYTHSEEVVVSPAVEAGNRYGVRYEELLVLMMHCLQQKLA
ncbi:hypothetical protein D3C76_557530 [compost metagenome]